MEVNPVIFLNREGPSLCWGRLPACPKRVVVMLASMEALIHLNMTLQFCLVLLLVLAAQEVSTVAAVMNDRSQVIDFLQMLGYRHRQLRSSSLCLHAV